MSDLDAIKKIEELIGKPLIPCPADSDIMDWDHQNTFLLSSQQQVTGLNICSNQISDISVLKALPNLTQLILSDNPISGDISVLKTLPNLTQLDLSDNQISDISSLKALPNLTKLDLSGNQISDISSLKVLPNLTQLYLSGNQISDINSLKALPNLTQLYLGANQISDISILKALPNLTQLYLGANPISDISVLKALPNLNHLNLWENQISDISVLKALPNLTQLVLSDNPISDISVLKALPNLTQLDLSENQISDIRALKALPNLTELDLSGNQMSDIRALKALLNLTELDLSGNQISDISVLKALPNLTQLKLSYTLISDFSVLKALPNLRKLYLSHNQISDISVLKALPNLRKLYLSHNQISDISVLKALPNLTHLDLRNNQISELPEWLVNLNIPILWKNIYINGVFLEKNPLEEPPPEIIDLGNEAIKAYFNGGERKAINEIKIILVGAGSSGKTSLSKVLRGEDFDEHENQTHGINIYKKEINGVSVNYWDFGGQEMMHSTHQFFLSSRSIYVLVLDGRKEEDAEYWLKYIESFGGNSPVLIVINKIDQEHIFDVNRKFLQEKYSGIHGFYKLSCRSKEGIGQLKNGIQEAFNKVPLIRSKLPKTWFEVKSQLENMPLDKNFIHFQAFRELCEQQQINDSATQDILSRYLNDLGVIIHFTDPKLIGIPVLKPRWITQAIYKIINFKSVAEAHGIFNLTHLSSVLAKITDDDFDYPRETHSYIIELMLKFEICYQVDKNTILIPDLLEIQEPDFEFDNESSEILRFRIRYDFLPLSIMPRFIVRLHHDIKNHYRWRTGVILEDKNLDALAIVKVDYKDKLINIVVSGTQKRDYFATIRKTFNDIHDSFEKLGVVELVPLPDCPDYEIEYQELIGFENARKDDYFAGKLGKSYSVSALLNGIEKPEERHREDTRYYVQGDLIQGDKLMGDKIKIGDIDGDINGVIGSGNQTAQSEPKKESLFKSWTFWLSVFCFIYFCFVLFASYDLQKQGLLGNKSFKEIVLAPISLLSAEDKKKSD